MPDANRAARLRIAALLLAPRDSEGVVRAPLPDDQVKARVRAMPALERARLTGQVNFVREYEGAGDSDA